MVDIRCAVCGTYLVLEVEWRRHRTTKNWINYQNYKRKLDKIIGKVKYDYYDKKNSACKSDLKKTWNNINTILGRKRRNRLLTFNTCDTPHNFNKYFTSIASNLINRNYPDGSNTDSYSKYLKPNDKVFDNAHFEVKDLEHFISQLNT